MNTTTIDPRRTSLHGDSIPGPSTLPPVLLTTSTKKKRPSHSAAPPPPSSALDGSPPPDSTLDLGKVRAYAACKSCRLKKIKCLPGPPTSRSGTSSGLDASGAPGICQQCSQAGLECTYPPTRDRAAYSRQYVQNLEGRVHSLEAVNARLMPMLLAFERGSGMEILKTEGLAEAGAQGGVVYPPLVQIRQNGGGSGQMVLDNDDDEVSNGVGLEREQEGEQDQEQEQDFGDDTGQMTQDEHGNFRWIGSSNTLSLLDSFTPTSPRSRSRGRPPIRIGQSTQPGAGGPTSTGGSSNPYFARVAGSGVIKALPTVDEVLYPEPAAAMDMIDAYFREIHPILPIMIEQEFREAYAALMDRRARNVPETSGIFISVVFAMFALGERVLVTSAAWKREKQKAGNVSPGTAKVERGTEETVLPGEAEAGVVWYERAQILRYTTITDISLHQVQSLILMAAFQASVNAMPMSWLLCGIALRMAQDLGLHRSAARLQISYADKQVRSRCWWAAYGLDRMLSLTLGRPPGVEDLDIDVPYPADLDDETLLSLSHGGHASGHSPIPTEPTGCTMSGYTALTKLCKIAGRISHILYRPSHGRSVNDPAWFTSQQNSINKLDKALRDWLEHDVPAKYKDQSQDQGIQLVSAALSNTYFACVITLHRNFLPPSVDSSRPRPPPSSTSLSQCVAAARSVIHIAAQSKILLPPSHHLAVFCQYLWSAAVMLLLCEVQAKDQVVVDAVGPQVDSCRRSLRALEPVWPGARKLKELLDEAERRGKEVIKSSMKRPSKKRRKSSHHDSSSGQKRPAAVLKRHSTSTSRSSPPRSGTPSSWAVPPPLRSPMGARPTSQGYETSDTRTSLPDSSFAIPTNTTRLDAPLPIGNYGPPGGFAPTIAPSDLSQSLDYTFDVGGVDFDGLEMLQGFNNDLASLWSTLLPDQTFDPMNTNTTPQVYPSTKLPQVGIAPIVSGSNPTIAPSHPHTMTSTPSSSGPSPHPSQSAWMHQNQSPQVGSTPGFTQVHAPYGNLMDLGSSEFWSQIAARGQDWGADPNIPFNF